MTEDTNLEERIKKLIDNPFVCGAAKYHLIAVTLSSFSVPDIKSFVEIVEAEEDSE